MRRTLLAALATMASLFVGCDALQHREATPPAAKAATTPSAGQKDELDKALDKMFDEESIKRGKNIGRFQLLYAPANPGPLVLRMDTTTGETCWLAEKKFFHSEKIVLDAVLTKEEAERFRWISVGDGKKLVYNPATQRIEEQGAAGDHVWTPEEVKKLREQQSSNDPAGLFTPEENAKRKAKQK